MTGNHESIKVKAYELPDMKFAGEFESLSKASRKLFVRRANRIWEYIFGKKGCTFKESKKGVSSYKGKKYHFEQVKEAK